MSRLRRAAMPNNLGGTDVRRAAMPNNFGPASPSPASAFVPQYDGAQAQAGGVQGIPGRIGAARPTQGMGMGSAAGGMMGAGSAGGGGWGGGGMDSSAGAGWSGQQQQPGLYPSLSSSSTMGGSMGGGAAASSASIDLMNGVMKGAMGGGGSAVIQDVVRAQGEKFVKQQTTRLLSCLNISGLKVYFAVDNAYVLRKLLLILFPFRHASWRRQVDASQFQDGKGTVSFYPPHDDLNAPDLYIPTMGFITYILLYAYMLGIQSRFNPEVLSLAASWAFVTLFVEILLMTGGFWFLNASGRQQPALLDLVAVASYKFVGIILGMLAALFFGSTAYYAVTCFAGVTMGIFMVKTLGFPFNSDNPKEKKILYFLFVMGLLQVVLAVTLSKSALPVA